MSIITISRGSFSHGREVAEKVAEKLGYANVSREVLITASKEFNVPEIKLAQAVHDAPSFFDRFTHSKERYVAYIESALLDQFRQDNIVYHGLAGHFFIRNISHVLKVRILAQPEDRIAAIMRETPISRQQALAQLEKDNRARREWSRRLYGIDTANPELYDMVLHVHKLTTDDAAAIICETVNREQFRSTPQSRQAVDDLALAARMKAECVEIYPDIHVSAKEGCLTVKLHAAAEVEKRVVGDLTLIARRIPGVVRVEIEITPTTIVDSHR